MSSIGFMGVGLYGLRSSMGLDLWMCFLVPCGVPLTAMGLEEIDCSRLR